MTEPLATQTFTRAVGRALIISATSLLAAALWGRVDLVVLAAPLLVGTVLGLVRAGGVRAGGVPAGASLSLDRLTCAEADELNAFVQVENHEASWLDAVVVRLRHSASLTSTSRDRPTTFTLAPDSQHVVQVAAAAAHWGHGVVGPAEVNCVGGDGLIVWAPTRTAKVDVRVLPLVAPFRVDASLPRTTAQVGTHAATALGHDGELTSVRRLAPGDRLRRIDWRSTLRNREPYVVATTSDRDAELVLILDVSRSAGQSRADQGAPSVVDTAVRAAGAIAQHYLGRGDRVSLIEYTGRVRRLRPGSGQRQLHLALDWLLATRAPAESVAAGGGIRPAMVPNSAIVVVLSPLIRPEGGAMAAELARSGRTVTVVDTLGALAQRQIAQIPGAATALSPQWAEVARRLWLAERQNQIDALREIGVPVVGWSGPSTLDQVLTALSRVAKAPRLRLR